MGECAVNVARACNYTGAGTVEFLLDENKNFYFLEMNTRLQVEHPVTELITGIDLVREQIHIAEGHPLSFTQEELKISGHAIELRVYAEDPENGFLPDIGTLKVYRKPEGPGVRVDDGFRERMTVPVYYDPMLSKLSVWAKTREDAIERMKRAIEEYVILGVQTTLSFGAFVMNHEAFRNGSYDTHFVKNYYEKRTVVVNIDFEKAAAIASVIVPESQKMNSEVIGQLKKTKSNWKRNRLS
jgi:acetyl/propionyl-CoA carboxylase alpha subunit